MCPPNAGAFRNALMRRGLRSGGFTLPPFMRFDLLRAEPDNISCVHTAAQYWARCAPAYYPVISLKSV